MNNAVTFRDTSLKKKLLERSPNPGVQARYWSNTMLRLLSEVDLSPVFTEPEAKFLCKILSDRILPPVARFVNVEPNPALVEMVDQIVAIECNQEGTPADVSARALIKKTKELNLLERYALIDRVQQYQQIGAGTDTERLIRANLLKK